MIPVPFLFARTSIAYSETAGGIIIRRESMAIKDWLKGRKSNQEEEEFLDIETPRFNHSDPVIRELIEKISGTRRELNWTSWKIYQLEKRGDLSEFERHQLKSLPEKFKRLVKLYRAQEAQLRRLQEKGTRGKRFSTNS